MLKRAQRQVEGGEPTAVRKWREPHALADSICGFWSPSKRKLCQHLLRHCRQVTRPSPTNACTHGNDRSIVEGRPLGVLMSASAHRGDGRGVRPCDSASGKRRDPTLAEGRHARPKPPGPYRPEAPPRPSLAMLPSRVAVGEVSVNRAGQAPRRAIAGCDVRRAHCPFQSDSGETVLPLIALLGIVIPRHMSRTDGYASTIAGRGRVWARGMNARGVRCLR